VFRITRARPSLAPHRGRRDVASGAQQPVRWPGTLVLARQVELLFVLYEFSSRFVMYAVAAGVQGLGGGSVHRGHGLTGCNVTPRELITEPAGAQERLPHVGRSGLRRITAGQGGCSKRIRSSNSASSQVRWVNMTHVGPAKGFPEQRTLSQNGDPQAYTESQQGRHGELTQRAPHSPHSARAREQGRRCDGS
jgi:hypothetical protein